MHWMKMVAMWLLVIGGLAWAYEGFMGKNIFSMMGNSYAEMGAYALMGISALFVGFKMITCKKHCEGHHE